MKTILEVIAIAIFASAIYQCTKAKPFIEEVDPNDNDYYHRD